MGSEEVLLKSTHEDLETLDHKDSYELHYERSKESNKLVVDDMEVEIVDTTSMDEMGDQDHVELMEESFEILPLSSEPEVMEEMASWSNSPTPVTVQESLISLQKSTASDLVNTALQNAVEEAASWSHSPTPAAVEEKESLISLQKSTASDLVNTALQNAVEHVSSLSLEQ